MAFDTSTNLSPSSSAFDDISPPDDIVVASAVMQAQPPLEQVQEQADHAGELVEDIQEDIDTIESEIHRLDGLISGLEDELLEGDISPERQQEIQNTLDGYYVEREQVIGGSYNGDQSNLEDLTELRGDAEEVQAELEEGEQAILEGRVDTELNESNLDNIEELAEITEDVAEENVDIGENLDDIADVIQADDSALANDTEAQVLANDLRHTADQFRIEAQRYQQQVIQIRNIIKGISTNSEMMLNYVRSESARTEALQQEKRSEKRSEMFEELEKLRKDRILDRLLLTRRDLIDRIVEKSEQVSQVVTDQILDKKFENDVKALDVLRTRRIINNELYLAKNKRQNDFYTPSGEDFWNKIQIRDSDSNSQIEFQNVEGKF